mmetsp:Transcript_30174/g.77957  ORF Transcript_30174/g.77957 Transcript_30174/m.77957 type:complete len:250 (-) Transcript_30174:34-783(-)
MWRSSRVLFTPSTNLSTVRGSLPYPGSIFMSGGLATSCEVGLAKSMRSPLPSKHSTPFKPTYHGSPHVVFITIFNTFPVGRVGMPAKEGFTAEASEASCEGVWMFGRGPMLLGVLASTLEGCATTGLSPPVCGVGGSPAFTFFSLSSIMARSYKLRGFSLRAASFPDRRPACDRAKKASESQLSSRAEVGRLLLPPRFDILGLVERLALPTSSGSTTDSSSRASRAPLLPLRLPAIPLHHVFTPTLVEM